jgi:hypothetical protein
LIQFTVHCINRGFNTIFLMFEETRPWRATRTPGWSLIFFTRLGHLEAVGSSI